MTDAQEKFKRALDKALNAHGAWAQAPVLGDQSQREKLADEAVVAENEVLRLYAEKGRRRPSIPKRVYTCEGCGAGNPSWSGGPSRRSRTEVPDGIARWCAKCAPLAPRDSGNPHE